MSNVLQHNRVCMCVSVSVDVNVHGTHSHMGFEMRKTRMEILTYSQHTGIHTHTCGRPNIRFICALATARLCVCVVCER